MTLSPESRNSSGELTRLPDFTIPSNPLRPAHLLARQVFRRLIFTSHIQQAAIGPVSRRPSYEWPVIRPKLPRSRHLDRNAEITSGCAVTQDLFAF